jgi:hypothetical protein
MHLLHVGAKIRSAKISFSSDSITSRIGTRELGFVMDRPHVLDVAGTPIEGVVLVMVAVSRSIPVVETVFVWTRVSALTLSVVLSDMVIASQVLGQVIFSFETIRPVIFIAV